MIAALISALRAQTPPLLTPAAPATSSPPLSADPPLIAAFQATVERLAAQAQSETMLWQAGAIVIAALGGWLLARPARAGLDRAFSSGGDTALERFRGAVKKLIAPVIAAILLWTALPALIAANLPGGFVRLAAILLTSWIVINVIASPIRDRFLRRLIAGLVWVAAVLNVVRLLEPTIAAVDSVHVPFSKGEISVYDVLRASVLAVVLIWAAISASRLAQRRLSTAPGLTPSVRGLVSQLVHIFFILTAIILALNVAGVDLTAFAVLSGAIGVGIGFGLQSIFQNFIAGIIILLEKSLKVGDFVDLESGITGEVREINVRSTLVTTNDNIDILVPNAEFITNRVTNWTLREAHRRLRVPFGVAYGTDKELVKKAALEAAEVVPYTLKSNARRKPQVWLVNFGESSLDFELVVWLSDDSVKRPGAVQAAYLWELETALNRHGIVIPFPQRDLHIISPENISVKVSP